MARNRQRAKQRQAERRARRLAEEGGDRPLVDDPTATEPSPAVPPELAVGAPPTNEGRSDTVMRDEPNLDDPLETGLEAPDEVEDWEAEVEADGAAPVADDAGHVVRGRRGREDARPHANRPRVIQFLVAVWAELQRVQWPNRQALTTLTGVVLGFVLIAGGYLGLLDAIFSKIIKAIL